MRVEPFPDWFDVDVLSQAAKNAKPLVMGVSGGPDSMAMLHLTLQWAETHGIPLVAVHVNHNQRGAESASDEQFVLKQCGKHGVEIRIFHLPAWPGCSEENLRHQRYACFATVLDEMDSVYLALGHNRDDLVETFLFHLVRGTGLEGLSFQAVNNTGEMSVLRPLWKAERTSILNYMKAGNLPFVIDESNNNLKYSRNVLRHIILPEIENRINSNARGAIWRMAEMLKETYGLVAELAGIAVRRAQFFGVQDVYRIELMIIQPPAILSEMIRQILITSGVNPGSEMIARIRSDILQKSYDEVAAGNGTWLIVEYDYVWICKTTSPVEGMISREDIAKQAMAKFPELFLGRLAEPVQMTLSTNAEQCVTISLLDRTYKTLPLVLDHNGETQIRNRLKGDVAGRSTTLKKRMIDRHIPRYQRDFVIVVASGSQILKVFHPAFES